MRNKSENTNSTARWSARPRKGRPADAAAHLAHNPAAQRGKQKPWLQKIRQPGR